MNDKVSKKEIASYVGYGVGECISFGLAGSFTLIFYTDVFGISAVSASLIFLLARAWDAVIDPIVASVMDTIHSPIGKFRVYMKYVPLFVVITTVLCFVKPDFGVEAKIVYAGITYLMWGTVYAMSDVPFWSMSAVMTQDPIERSKLVTYAGLAVSVGGAIPLFCFPFLIKHFGASSPAHGYFWGTIILMVVAFILMNNGYRNTRERVTRSEEKVKLSQVFKTLWANKPLFLVLLAFFTNLFSNVASAIAVYFFTYNMNAPEMLSIYGVINMCCAFGLVLIPYILTKCQKKSLLIIFCAIDIVLRILFFYWIGYSNLVTFFIMVALTGIMTSVSWPILSAMIGDTIDYAEAKTGNRCEAIMFAGQTFTGKLAIAVSGGLVGLILILVGYKPNVQQSSFALKAIFFSVVLLPAVGSLLKIIILQFYHFTEDKLKEVKLQIAESKK
ncbi:MAG: MFS transporter [Lentisphaerota bacterium]